MARAVQITGADEVFRTIERMGKNGVKAAKQGLRLEGEAIMANSKKNFVPVKEGILRSSGKVSGPRAISEGWFVHLTFGGPATPYARRQHEDLTLKHTVGESKYLEKPAFQAMRGMAERIAIRMRAAIFKESK